MKIRGGQGMEAVQGDGLLPVITMLKRAGANETPKRWNGLPTDLLREEDRHLALKILAYVIFTKCNGRVYVPEDLRSLPDLDLFVSRSPAGTPNYVLEAASSEKVQEKLRELEQRVEKEQKIIETTFDDLIKETENGTVGTACGSVGDAPKAVTGEAGGVVVPPVNAAETSEEYRLGVLERLLAQVKLGVAAKDQASNRKNRGECSCCGCAIPDGQSYCYLCEHHID